MLLSESLRSRHAPHRPNHLLASHSIGWARENGFRYYNWQGSPPGSGVERFKRQWGGREYDYCFFTRITGDPSPYLDSSVSQLLDGYRWHYVLPFDRLGTKRAAALGPSSRSGAWDALETAE